MLIEKEVSKQVFWAWSGFLGRNSWQNQRRGDLPYKGMYGQNTRMRILQNIWFMFLLLLLLLDSDFWKNIHKQNKYKRLDINPIKQHNMNGKRSQYLYSFEIFFSNNFFIYIFYLPQLLSDLYPPGFRFFMESQYYMSKQIWKISTVDPKKKCSKTVTCIHEALIEH